MAVSSFFDSRNGRIQASITFRPCMKGDYVSNALTTLAANDGTSTSRKAVARFRRACQENQYTRWIQPKKLLSKEAQSSTLPLSWTVRLAVHGDVSITPDAILGFKVLGCTARALLLSIDYGA